MRFRIFDKCGSNKISARTVTGQHDFLRVDSKFFRMVKGVSNDTVRLLDCCRKRLFRCKAVVHIPDKAVQLLHQGAAIAAVTVGAALDKATTVEIQQQGCFGRQMLWTLLEQMDFATIGHFDPHFFFGAGQSGQLFRTDRTKSVTAAHSISHSNFFFKRHRICAPFHRAQNAGNTVMV